MVQPIAFREEKIFPVLGASALILPYPIQLWRREVYALPISSGLMLFATRLRHSDLAGSFCQVSCKCWPKGGFIAVQVRQTQNGKLRNYSKFKQAKISVGSFETPSLQARFVHCR